MSSANETKRWWQTLPAILGSVAAVLASLAALIPVVQNLYLAEPIERPPAYGNDTEPGEHSTRIVLAESDMQPATTGLVNYASPALLSDAAMPDSMPPAATAPGTISSNPSPTVAAVAETAAELTVAEDVITADDAAEAGQPDQPTSSCRPCKVALRVKTRDPSPSEIVIAFTDTDPVELVHAADPDGLIRQKFTFSGKSGRLWTYEQEASTLDAAFLDSRYVLVYNEGGNGWDGWLQLVVDGRLVIDQQISQDLKNFRRPEMSSHRYWSKQLKADA